MDAEFFELRHGLVKILRAGAPMTAGPCQNVGHLLKRQCVYIVIKVRGMRIRDQRSNRASSGLHIDPPYAFQRFVAAHFPLQQKIKL